jgi:3-isopropylmalate/(R)-2-methylmalate dehydratase small subunit
VDRLFDYLLPQPGATLTVDLPAQTISVGDTMTFAFEIGAIQKTCLVQGLDEISFTERYSSDISSFETAYGHEFPWLIGQLGDGAR